jgi:hypothetical protein
VLPPRPANDTSPTDPTMSGATPPQHPKFDSGALLVGDVTDIIEDTALLGEKTAVTRMDPTDGEVDGDGTRTKVTAIHEDSDDTAERKRKRASDSGHTTIEEEIVFQSGTWTPQTTPAQHVTTDPDLPPAQLPAEAKAEVEHAALASADANAAAAARAAANAAAAAQAHAAAKMLAAQKGRTAPPAAAPTRTGAPRQGASASTAHGSQNPLGATLPGLFPAALPRGPTARTGTPARGNAAIAIGSTPTIAKAEPAVVTARPTGLVPDVRPKRGGLLAGLVLAGLAGIAGGVLYVTQTDEAEEAQTTAPPSPAPAMQGEPAPTPPVQPATGSATAPAPPTPPTADGETKTVEPPAPTPPTAPVAPKPGATQKTSTTGKTGAKPSGGKIGTKPGRGKTTRDDKRDDKRDATPAGGKTTKPPSDDDRAFGVRDPTKPR